MSEYLEVLPSAHSLPTGKVQVFGKQDYGEVHMTEELWLIKLARALTYINGIFFFFNLPSAPYSVSFDKFV